MWIDQQVVETAHEPVSIKVFIPSETVVVLGRSNKSTEADTKQCEQDGVTILKRSGGGGSVVLYPGCLVVSIGLWVKHFYKNAEYFQALNQAVINSCADYAPQLDKLSQRGISDLAYGQEKVAGTSLFRSRNYLLYQASILCNLDVNMISRYLPHPSKEPDYRLGRRHSDFLTSVDEILPNFQMEAFSSTVAKCLPSHITTLLGSEMIPAPELQIEYVKKRFFLN